MGRRWYLLWDHFGQGYLHSCVYRGRRCTPNACLIFSAQKTSGLHQDSCCCLLSSIHSTQHQVAKRIILLLLVPNAPLKTKQTLLIFWRKKKRFKMAVIWKFHFQYTNKKWTSSDCCCCCCLYSIQLKGFSKGNWPITKHQIWIWISIQVFEKRTKKWNYKWPWQECWRCSRFFEVVYNNREWLKTSCTYYT